MKIRTPYTNEPSLGEFNNGIIITVPDQALSLKDLLAQVRAGKDVKQFEPQYYENLIVPNPKMDLVDIQNQRELLETNYEQTTETIKKNRKSQVLSQDNNLETTEDKSE
ncbi:hypothetical protein [Flavobacterium sp.]|uniref:hypothetical protein n=1 Tax=Flavobacterium sp. TaxID=239 RepID=UPI003751313C